MDEMEAGTELDAAVSRLLGWEPRGYWIIDEDDGLPFGNYHTTEDEAMHSAAEYGMDRYHLEPIYEPVSTDGNVTLSAVEEMRKRGFLYEISDMCSVPSHAAGFYGEDGKASRMEADTPQLAVALAIYYALKEPETKPRCRILR